MEWALGFSVDNFEIDEQHKKLVEMINNVDALLKNRRYEFSNLLETVNELDKYVEEHLSYEEELMKKLDYPDIKEHMAQHDLLRRRMHEFNIYEVDNPAKFYIDILSYLINWLGMHIMEKDKKLGIFLIGKI